MAAILAWFEIRTWQGFEAAGRELLVPVQWAGMAGMAGQWANRLAGLGVFLVLQVACLGAGSVLAGILRMRPRILRDLPLGWLVLGTAFAGISLAGLAYLPVLVFVAAAPLCFAGWRDIALIGRIRKIPGEWGMASQGPGKTCILLSVAVLAAVAACGMAPETEGDPLTCHYANPLRILGLHRMTAWPFSIHDDYPFLYESLLLPLFSAGGEYAARWFNPFLLALLFPVVYRAGSRFMGKGWAAAGAALAVTSPFLASQAVFAKNDLLLAVFGISAIDAVSAGRSPRAFLSAGLFCGGAIATKYNGAYLVPALFLAGLAFRGAPVSRLFLLVPGAVLGALPVMSKNLLFTGDPLYPFAGALFAGPFSSPIMRERLREHLYVLTLQDPSAIGPGLVFKSLLGAGPAPDESLGRWFLLLPLLFAVRRIAPEARIHLAALAVILVAWAAGPPHARYAAAIFPSGCILAAYGIGSLAPGGRRNLPAVAAGALILAQTVHSTASVLNARMIRAGLGLEDAASYRARRVGPAWAAIQALEKEAVPARRVLLHGENRSALLAVPADFSAFGGPTFPPFGDIAASHTAEELVKKLRQRGWTHVIYNRVTAFYWSRSMADDPWSERDLALWSGFWDKHAELVFESPKMDLERGYYYLFRILKAPRVHNRAVLPGIEGWVWRMEKARKEGNRMEFGRLLGSLRRVAGNFGVTDRVEADMAAPGEPREKVRSLLVRAVDRGFRSPAVYRRLAAIAVEEGDFAGAARWARMAGDLEPGEKHR
jgi:hypothetical protein